jgi:hypothetical protein
MGLTRFRRRSWAAARPCFFKRFQGSNTHGNLFPEESAHIGQPHERRIWPT